MARIEKRELADGTKRYKAIVRRKGHPIRTRTCRTRAQADAWARKVESEILDGRVVRGSRERNRTLGDLIERYNDEIVPRYKERIAAERKSYLTWWLEHLGPDIRLRDIGRARINKALRALESGSTPSGRPASPATQNRYAAALRHAFNEAERRWEWPIENPLKGMARREPRGRVRCLGDAERDRLLEACQASKDRRLYPLVLTALSTGARQGELMGLRWPEIDIVNGWATLNDTKNAERRRVPIRGAALTEIQRLREVRSIRSDHVFADRRGRCVYPRAAFEKAVTDAEIVDFRFHDLRHTAASYLAMSGATLLEIAEILGHKTLAMVKRYSHLTDHHSSAVVGRMAERFLP